MPNSCKCILDHLKYKGAITEKEYDKILRNLKGVDWIPVTERLPKKAGEYFITYLSESGKYAGLVPFVCIAYWTGYKWEVDVEEKDDVTAWMPFFLKPYERSEEE